MSRLIILMSLLTWLASSHVAAQGTPQVREGSRIRVTAPSSSSDPIVGSLLRLDADSCVLEVRGIRGWRCRLVLSPIWR